MVLAVTCPAKVVFVELTNFATVAASCHLLRLHLWPLTSDLPQAFRQEKEQSDSLARRKATLIVKILFLVILCVIQGGGENLSRKS
jgi:hypothetical protein